MIEQCKCQQWRWETRLWEHREGNHYLCHRRGSLWATSPWLSEELTKQEEESQENEVAMCKGMKESKRQVGILRKWALILLAREERDDNVKGQGWKEVGARWWQWYSYILCMLRSFNFIPEAGGIKWEFIFDHIINAYFPKSTYSFMRKKKGSLMFSIVPNRSLIWFESMIALKNCSWGWCCGVDRFCVLEREPWRNYGEHIWRDTKLEAGVNSFPALVFILFAESIVAPTWSTKYPKICLCFDRCQLLFCGATWK